MKNVFEPFTIGTLSLKNRIVRAATHEGMATADGMPTEDLLRTYRNIAAGGAGAIITGYVGVSRNGRTFPNMRMFDNDSSMDAYRSLNENLKQYHAPVILQIAHGGSRCMSRVTGADVISASPRRRNDFGERVREAGDAEVRAIIDAFVAAIVRARAAGFGGVELHAAHGYLLSEFVSPALNRRSDRWGGSTENRLRIVTEILAQARRAVGGFPIFAKISAHDGYAKGMTAAETVAVARLLQAAGCDALEVSCGYGDFMSTVRMTKVPVDAVLGLMPPYRDMAAYKKRLFRTAAPFLARVRTPISKYNVEAAELIKRSVDIPVIVVGGIRTLPDIRTIVEDKGIDAVSLSRPFVIEPDIVDRFRKGQERSKCIDCGYCLIGCAASPLRCYYGKVPKVMR